MATASEPPIGAVPGPGEEDTGEVMLLVYVIPLVAAVFVGCVLWKKENPPSFGYVAFALFGGALLFMAMVDTKWLDRVPAIEWGGQRYGVIQRQLTEIRKSLVGYETEVIKGSEALEVRELAEKEDGHPLYSVRLELKYPAVPDSVLLWEGSYSKAPNTFSVAGRTVNVLTVVNAQGVKTTEYVFRYFRMPEKGGAGEGGAGEGGAGD